MQSHKPPVFSNQNNPINLAICTFAHCTFAHLHIRTSAYLHIIFQRRR
jgi:hypothetical protein